MSSHTNRIAFAKSERRCFACANYARPFETFSALCLKGGLDPKKTESLRNSVDASIWATVSWDNACPRFSAVIERRAA